MRHNLTPSAPRQRLKHVALGCSLLVLSLTANAMDLLQAYQAAQQNDSTLAAARAGATAERERLPQAKAQLMPNLSASFSRNSNRLESIAPNFFGVEQTTFNAYPSGSRNLTLRQPVYRPQLLEQYRQAQAQVNDAEAILQQEEQGLAVRVSGAYFEAMLTHDQLALVMAQKTATTTQLDAARKSLQAGYGTRTDVDEAQSRLDMSLAQEIEARQNVTYTLQQLEMLVNQPIDKLATLNVAQLELLPPQPNSLEEWTERALRNSPQMQSLAARVEIAREESRRANSGHYPTLDAVAQWSDSKSESVSNTSSQYINSSIGLQLNIPIFAGGAVSSQVRQTLAGLERAQHSLEAGRRDLQIRVHKEFRGVSESIPKIRALEQALRSADQLVLSSKKSFQGGSRTTVDIMNAEQQRVAVLRDLAQARYIYLISHIRLLALVGGADMEAVQMVNRSLQN